MLNHPNGWSERTGLRFALLCLCSYEDRACPRLLEVLMHDSRLYLIFEFLSMDLKKYLDSIPSGQYMEPMLVKVSLFISKWASNRRSIE